MIKIYTDGGTRGCVICVHDPQTNRSIVKRRKGKNTNNDLEYLALIFGVEYIKNNYPNEQVTICSDSKLIVNHINDNWKCNPENLRTLLSVVKRKMNGNITVKWVPREKNLAGIHLEKYY